MKNVSILGSTGSIGTQTLEVIDFNKEDFNVVAISGNYNIKLLEEQTRKYMPEIVCVYDFESYKNFKISVNDLNIKICTGIEGLIEIATMNDVDIVVMALVGMVGIRPVVNAIKNKKIIALANKESIVAAGHIIVNLAEKYKTKILPVDSEHSAIFQCLNCANKNKIDKIILTASGGAFYGKTKKELEHITIKDALKNANWTMGDKVTIDSSTLANKGLEVIEAKWLFNVEYKDIQVVIHPQSIVHSMVQFIDGAVIAQLAIPDMKLPIQYALTYPYRQYSYVKHIDFYALSHIDFYKPNIEVFPALKYAYEAIKYGGSMPMIFNLFNEIAVMKFIKGEIKYLDIASFIRNGMDNHNIIKNPDLDTILNLEHELRMKYT